jgi:uncharacterized membrane protein (DUF106 family)
MESTTPPARPAPDPKKQLSTFFTIFIFVFAMFVLFDTQLRQWLGDLVGVVFEPTVGFNGAMPVVTLFLTGIIMTGLTVVVRHFFTDYVSQAENQKIVGAFNKELRQARVENNKYKIKKLTEQQQKILKKSMDMSTTQMKLMPLTMLIVIPIFAWLDVFMRDLSNIGTDVAPIIVPVIVNLPWAMNVDLLGTTLLPNWVLLYSLISIPFGQILMRALRYFEFKNRLREVEAVEAQAA